MAGNVTYLNDDNFDQEIAKGTTLVDFYADWCGPCRMIAPIIEELSNEMNGKAKIAKLDIENAQQVTSRLGVTSIPTIIVFKNGQEASRVVGVKGKEDLKKMVEQSL
jgi:thioredoxin 1